MSNESTIISDSADAGGLRTPHQDVAGAVEKKRERYLLAVFLVWYALLMYGGVRSPDSEVVFQTGQAIADHGTTAVDGIWGWPGFGIARGVDGRHYSVFGPL